MINYNHHFVVQSLSRVQLFSTPWTAACQASLYPTISQSLHPRLLSQWMLSNHLILCCPLFLLLSFFSSIRVFSSCLHQVAKVLELQHQSFQYSRLISFRIDWFDLAVQGTLKNLLQHHNSKASIIYSSLWSTSHICT